MNKIWKVVLIILVSVIGALGITFLGIYLAGGFDENKRHPENLFFADSYIDDEGNIAHESRGSKPYYEYENFKLILSTSTEDFNQGDVELSFPSTQSGSNIVFLKKIELDEVLGGVATSYYAYDYVKDENGDIEKKVVRFGSCGKEQAEYITNGNIIIPINVRINNQFDVFLCLAPDNTKEEIILSENGQSVVNELFNLGGYAQIIAKSSNLTIGSTRAEIYIDVPVKEMNLVGITYDNVPKPENLNGKVLGLNEKTILKNQDGRIDVSTEGLFSAVLDIIPARSIYRYGKNGDFGEAEYKTVVFTLNPDEGFISFADKGGEELSDKSSFSFKYIINQEIDLKEIFGETFKYSDYDISFDWRNDTSILKSVISENGKVFVNIKDDKASSNFEIKVIASPKGTGETLEGYIYGNDNSLKLGFGAKITTRGAIFKTEARSGTSQIHAGIFINSVQEDAAKANIENNPKAIFDLMEGNEFAITKSMRLNVKEIAIDGFDVAEQDRFNTEGGLDLTINQWTEICADDSSSDYSLGIKISSTGHAQNKMRNILMSIQYAVQGDYGAIWFDATQINEEVPALIAFKEGTNIVVFDNSDIFYYRPHGISSGSYWEVVATSAAEDLEKYGIIDIRIWLHYLNPEGELMDGEDGYGPYDVKTIINGTVDTKLAWQDGDLQTNNQLGFGNYNEIILLGEREIALKDLVEITNSESNPTYETIRFFVYTDNKDVDLENILNVKKYEGLIANVSRVGVNIYEVNIEDLNLIISDLGTNYEIEFNLIFAVVEHLPNGVPVIYVDEDTEIEYYRIISLPADSIGNIEYLPIRVQKALTEDDIKISLDTETETDDNVNGIINPYDNDANTYFLQNTTENIRYSIIVEEEKLFELLAGKGDIKLGAYFGNTKTNDIYFRYQQGSQTISLNLEDVLSTIFHNETSIGDFESLNERVFEKEKEDVLEGKTKYTFTFSVGGITFSENEDEKEAVIKLIYTIQSEDLPQGYVNPLEISTESFYIYSGKIRYLWFGTESEKIEGGDDGKIHVDKSVHGDEYFTSIYITKDGEKHTLTDFINDESVVSIYQKDFGLSGVFDIVVSGNSGVVSISENGGFYKITFLTKGEVVLTLLPDSEYKHSQFEPHSLTFIVLTNYNLEAEYKDNTEDDRVINYDRILGYTILGEANTSRPILFEDLIQIYDVQNGNRALITDQFDFTVSAVNQGLFTKIIIINEGVRGFYINEDFGKSASLIITATSSGVGSFEFIINIQAYNRIHIDAIEEHDGIQKEEGSYGVYAEADIEINGFKYQYYDKETKEYVDGDLVQNTLKYFLYDASKGVEIGQTPMGDKAELTFVDVGDVIFEDYKLINIIFAEVSEPTKYILRIEWWGTHDNDFDLRQDYVFYVYPNIQIEAVGDSGDIEIEDNIAKLNNKETPYINGGEIKVEVVESSIIVSFNENELIKLTRKEGNKKFESSYLRINEEEYVNGEIIISGVKNLSEQTIIISYYDVDFEIKYWAAPNIKIDNVETVKYNGKEYIPLYATQDVKKSTIAGWFIGGSGELSVNFGEIAQNNTILTLSNLYALKNTINLSIEGTGYFIEKTEEGLIKTTIVVSSGSGEYIEYITFDVLIFPFEWRYIEYTEAEEESDVIAYLNGELVETLTNETTGIEKYEISEYITINNFNTYINSNVIKYKLFQIIDGQETLIPNNDTTKEVYLGMDPSGLKLITQPLGDDRYYRLEFVYNGEYTFNYYVKVEGTQSIEINYPYADASQNSSSAEGWDECQNIYYTQFIDNEYILDLNSQNRNFQKTNFVNLFVKGTEIKQKNSPANYNKLTFSIYKVYNFSIGQEVSTNSDYIDIENGVITLKKDKNTSEVKIGYVIKVSTPNGAVAYYKIITQTPNPAPQIVVSEAGGENVKVLYKNNEEAEMSLSTDAEITQNYIIKLETNTKLEVSGISISQIFDLSYLEINNATDDIKYALIKKDNNGTVLTKNDMMYIYTDENTGDLYIVSKVAANRQEAILVIYTEEDGIISEIQVRAESEYIFETNDGFEDEDFYGDSVIDLENYMVFKKGGEYVVEEIENPITYTITFNNYHDLIVYENGSSFTVMPINEEITLSLTVEVYGGTSELSGGPDGERCVAEIEITIKPNIVANKTEPGENLTGETYANNEATGFELNIFEDLFQNKKESEGGSLEDYLYDVSINLRGGENDGEYFSLDLKEGSTRANSENNIRELDEQNLSKKITLYISPVAAVRTVEITVKVYKFVDSEQIGQAFTTTYILTVNPDTTVSIEYPDYGTGQQFNNESIYWEDYTKEEIGTGTQPAGFVEFLTSYAGITYENDKITATAAGNYIAKFGDDYYLIKAVKSNNDFILTYHKITVNATFNKELNITKELGKFVKFSSNGNFVPIDGEKIELKSLNSDILKIEYINDEWVITKLTPVSTNTEVKIEVKVDGIKRAEYKVIITNSPVFAARYSDNSTRKEEEIADTTIEENTNPFELNVGGVAVQTKATTTEMLFDVLVSAQPKYSGLNIQTPKSIHGISGENTQYAELYLLDNPDKYSIESDSMPEIRGFDILGTTDDDEIAEINNNNQLTFKVSGTFAIKIITGETNWLTASYWYVDVEKDGNNYNATYYYSANFEKQTEYSNGITNVESYEIIGLESEEGVNVASHSNNTLTFNENGIFYVRVVHNNNTEVYYRVVKNGTTTYYKDSRSQSLSFDKIFTDIECYDMYEFTVIECYDMYEFTVSFASSLGAVVQSTEINDPYAMLNYYYMDNKIPYEQAAALFEFNKKDKEGESPLENNVKINKFILMEKEDSEGSTLEIKYESRVVDILNKFGKPVGAVYQYEIIYDAKFPEENFNTLKKVGEDDYTYSKGHSQYSEIEQDKLEEYLGTAATEPTEIKISNLITLIAGTEYDLIEDILKSMLGLTAVDGSAFNKVNFKSTAILTHGTYNNNELNTILAMIGLSEKEIAGGGKLKSYTITPHGAQNEGNIVHLKLEFGGKTYILRIKINPNISIQSKDQSGIFNVQYNNNSPEPNEMRYELSNFVSLTNVQAKDIVMTVLIGSDHQFIKGSQDNKLQKIGTGSSVNDYGIKLYKTNLGGAVIRFKITDKFGYTATSGGVMIEEFILYYQNENGDSPTVVERPNEIFEGNDFLIVRQYENENGEIRYQKYEFFGVGTWKWGEVLTDQPVASGSQKLILLDNVMQDVSLELKSLGNHSFQGSNTINRFKLDYLVNTAYGGTGEIAGETFELTFIYKDENSPITETARWTLSISVKQKYQLKLKTPYNSQSEVYLRYGADVSLNDLFELWDLEEKEVVSNPDNISQILTYTAITDETYYKDKNNGSIDKLEFKNGEKIQFGGNKFVEGGNLTVVFTIKVGESTIIENVIGFDYNITLKYYNIDKSGVNQYLDYGVVIEGSSNLGEITYNDWSSGIKFKDYYGQDIEETPSGLTYAKNSGSADVNSNDGTIGEEGKEKLQAGESVVVDIKSNGVFIGSIKITLNKYYNLEENDSLEIKADNGVLPFKYSEENKKGWGQVVKALVSGKASGVLVEPLISGVDGTGHFSYSVVAYEVDGDVSSSAPTIAYSNTHKCVVVANVDQIETVIIEVSYMGKSLGVIKIDKNHNGNWTVDQIKTMIVFATFGKNGYEEPLFEGGEEGWILPNNITAPAPYTLDGWYTDPDFNGEKYTLGSAPDKTIVLYAKLTVKVKFNENEGTVGEGMDDQTFIYNQAQKLTKNAFTKTDYTFIGWNTKSDGTGTFYADQALVLNFTGSLTGPITLYAQWAKNSYTVEFESNGGTGSMDDQDFEYGTPEALTKNTFEKENHTFIGWNTVAAGTGTSYADQEIVQIAVKPGDGNDPIKLHAQWAKTTQEIKFYSEGELISELEPQTVEYGKLYGDLPTPTREGYIFIGWYTATSDGVKISEQTIVSDTKDHNLYAQWTAITYKLTFDSQGGDAIAPIWIAMGEEYGSVDGPLPAPTKIGYTFAGWYPEANGNGTEVKNDTPMVAADTTIYAKWTANTYKVKFEKNGEEGDGDVSGNMDEQELTYGTLEPLTANAFTRTGYTFIGWNTATNGSGVSYTDEQSVINLTEDKGGTVNLYAQWTANTYTVIFNENHSDESGASGYMENQTFTYGASEPLTANAFTRVGYTFAGWNTKSDGSGTPYADEKPVINLTTEGDFTLYAQWTANTYTVIFNENHSDESGASGYMENQTFTYGASEPLTANAFTRVGYTFAGWNTKSDGSGTPYADEKPVINLTTEGDFTLYAQWTANTYAVVFNANGGDGTMDDQLFEYDEEAKALTANAFERDGYTFIGWNTESDGSGTSYYNEQSVSNLTTENEETVNLYAQWAKDSYIVKFDKNNDDASGTMTDQEFEYGTPAALTANAFEREGYTFIGWNTEPDGGGDFYKDEEEVNIITDGTVNLYAQWTANTYTVIFNANDGDGEMDYQEFTYNEAQKLTANAFIREGYTFIGWNTKSDGTGTSYADEELITFNIDSEIEFEETYGEYFITLYAQWEEDSE